jgi:hypothetical protein
MLIIKGNSGCSFLYTTAESRPVLPPAQVLLQKSPFGVIYMYLIKCRKEFRKKKITVLPFNL